MKKSISLLANLLVSSTLFWGVPTVEADSVILKVPADLASYCNIKFPAMREDTLSWDRPVLDGATNTIDFYGPCDYDPLGLDEVRAQRRAHIHANHGDGD